MSKTQQGDWVHTGLLHSALRWDFDRKAPWVGSHDEGECKRRQRDAGFSAVVIFFLGALLTSSCLPATTTTTIFLLCCYVFGSSSSVLFVTAVRSIIFALLSNLLTASGSLYLLLVSILLVPCSLSVKKRSPSSEP